MTNKKTHRLALFIAYLALFAATLGISVGYKHWIRIHDKAKDALVQIEQVKTEIKQLKNQSSTTESNSQLVKTQAVLDEALDQLRNIQQQTHYSAQAVKQQIRELTIQQSQANKAPLDSGYLSITALHLLESAQWQMEYFYNKSSALKLLKRADALLMKMGSEEQATIREMLSQDIAQLKQYAIPSFVETHNKINQLQQAITPLAKLHENKQSNHTVNIFTIEKGDKKLINKIKSYINNSVDTVKHDELAENVISQADRQRMDLLLALHFENLKLQLTVHNQQYFKSQSQQISKFIQQYYPRSVSKQWLQDIDQLVQLNITPKLPMITSALISLQALPETAQ